jgi:hypothetical protein
MFEVVIIQHGPTHWEWQVQDREGVPITNGREKSRANAKYQGNRALFSLLAIGSRPMSRPESS